MNFKKIADTSFKNARQGDAVFAYLFIPSLGVLLQLVKANKEVQDIYIFHYNYLYMAYADYSTFFSEK